MNLLINILICVLTYSIMEIITWFTHKFIMHGFLWSIHKDHHQPRYAHTFERNDLFFLIFAIPCMVLFYFGTSPEINYLFFIALGVFLYGMTYFLIHDVLIHRRFNWFKKTKIPYLIGLRKAHKKHHKYLGKEHGECFGLLLVPDRFHKKKGQL